MILCAVRHCCYLADSAIEDFHVCVLHDAPQTRGILEKLQTPAAYWAHERPIVVPCGDLESGDFERRAAPEGALYAYQDKRLANVPTTASKQTYPAYDLPNTDYVGLGATPN